MRPCWKVHLLPVERHLEAQLPTGAWKSQNSFRLQSHGVELSLRYRHPGDTGVHTMPLQMARAGTSELQDTHG